MRKTSIQSLLLIFALFAATSTIADADVQITEIYSDSDIPGLVECGDAFYLQSTGTSDLLCSLAVTYAHIAITNLTSELSRKCRQEADGSLVITMEGYSPGENMCNESGGWFSPTIYSHVRQRCAYCKCPVPGGGEEGEEEELE